MRRANVDMTWPQSAGVLTTPPAVPPAPSRGVAFLRNRAPVLVPVLLLAVGLALSVGSLATVYRTDYETYYTGTLAPGNLTVVLPPLATEYLQMSLTQGACDVRVYPSTDAQWAIFNSSGALPPSWIDCTARNTTTTGDVHDLILVSGGSRPEPYNVTVLAYSIETPYAWVALPGTALALAGLLALVPRIAMERANRLRDEFSGKEETKEDKK